MKSRVASGHPGKALRVLEERRFERGAGRSRLMVDVPNRGSHEPRFAEAAQEKLFREDLYFRISAVPNDDSSLAASVAMTCAAGRPLPGKFSRDLESRGLELRPRPRPACCTTAGGGTCASCRTRWERAVIPGDGLSISPRGPAQLPVSKPDAGTGADGHAGGKFQLGRSLEEVTARAASTWKKFCWKTPCASASGTRPAAEKLGISPKTLRELRTAWPRRLGEDGLPRRESGVNASEPYKFSALRPVSERRCRGPRRGSRRIDSRQISESAAIRAGGRAATDFWASMCRQIWLSGIGPNFRQHFAKIPAVEISHKPSGGSEIPGWRWRRGLQQR